MAKSNSLATKVTRRGLLRAGTRLGIGAVGVGAGSLGWSRFVEPDWVEIERVELPLPRLTRAFDGLRIAQISDIHIEGGDMRERISDICRLVNAQKLMPSSLPAISSPMWAPGRKRPLCRV